MDQKPKRPMGGDRGGKNTKFHTEITFHEEGIENKNKSHTQSDPA